MPRRARTISPTGIYHVILRSVNQQQIFEEDPDFQKFLFTLSDAREKYGFEIYAYCLMSNHIHLLIYAPPEVLSKAFQSISSKFVLWYNQKYLRSGHLFQARFKSIPVETNEQFLRTIYYIHQNPVKAHMCRYPDEYPWSSIFAYYGRKDPTISIDKAINMVGSLQYVHTYFSNMTESEAENDILEALPKAKIVTEEQALLTFHSLTECRSPSDFQNLTKTRRTELIISLSEHRLSQNQIARLCGISRATVFRTLANNRLSK